jgi:signal transduction histidine kinase
LQAAVLSGDRRLIGRLASNLVENAIRHNVPNGRVRVWVDNEAGRATLAVANTGAPISPDEIDRLLQPFQRLTRQRTGQGDGFGLGLSIVSAIVDAHHASLDVRPFRNGGLKVEVRFPAVADLEPELPAREDRVLLAPAADSLELTPAGSAQIVRR